MALALFHHPCRLKAFEARLDARDDFDTLAHLTHEREAGQLFYSPLQLIAEVAFEEILFDELTRALKIGSRLFGFI